MYFLGVDSGGTKTAFLLTDETGRVRARHRSGAGSLFNIGSEGICRLIYTGAEEICRQAGIEPADIAYAGLGFPGYGEKPGSEVEVTNACANALYPAKVTCECDSYVAWAGSLAMRPGINIIAGTGANCYGVNELGESARSSGWGAHCDEGSCGWIGARVIQAFTKQSDGRLPRTALYEIFRSHFQIEDDTYFIHRLNEIAADASETAKLQLLLENAYVAGDATAASIYKEAAGELALAIHAVARKLGFAGGACAASAFGGPRTEKGEAAAFNGGAYTASYSGGLFNVGEKIITPLSDAVAGYGGKLAAPRFTPEQGACLTALRLYRPDVDFTGFVFV